MADLAETVREKCVGHFEAEYCSCDDLSGGCGAKLDLVVVSAQFEKVPLIKRHRLINTLMKEDGIIDKLHALTIHAWTPAQWETKKG
mmetsp:Transcript_56373/g.65860  ORF Transcript_56373/g.65860 Transcript_56373/m.65860 type:complete len:87 (-) Transcript_56373:309-569(-)|eukprot:CAMPEP_0194363208 /NCGR_PEP_ID=MMETSP0174-20130528/11080_1 /TAXON_ID=216777 /ORGANISM="Proboscia alata, Strain PI-D3" /LENGTH=86 /DNA_ID=CAMNT_0039136559 /DNA_START=36 /DNA_END=296 /DNA_ORIENTATION=-